MESVEDLCLNSHLQSFKRRRQSKHILTGRSYFDKTDKRGRRGVCECGNNHFITLIGDISILEEYSDGDRCVELGTTDCFNNYTCVLEILKESCVERTIHFCSSECFSRFKKSYDCGSKRCCKVLSDWYRKHLDYLHNWEETALDFDQPTS